MTWSQQLSSRCQIVFSLGGVVVRRMDCYYVRRLKSDLGESRVKHVMTECVVNEARHLLENVYVLQASSWPLSALRRGTKTEPKAAYPIGKAYLMYPASKNE